MRSLVCSLRLHPGDRVKLVGVMGEIVVTVRMHDWVTKTVWFEETIPGDFQPLYISEPELPYRRIKDS